MTAEEFVNICAANGLALDDGQVRCFRRFADDEIAWNEKINLISRKDVDQIWERHILHSAAILFHSEIPGGAMIADIGTGGGFPGIPLKICRPDLTMVLIDSIRKKIAAVDAIIADLRECDERMINLQAVCGRAEDLATLPAFAHAFDVVVVRAVAPLRELIAWSLPLLKPHGKLLAMKGGALDEEIAAVKTKSAPHVSISVKPLIVRGVTMFEEESKQLIIVQF